MPAVIPLSAFSCSASLNTTTGLFPPSSKLTCDKFSAEFFTICFAVSGPPVNAILSTRSCVVRALPQGSPKPVIMLTTPFGIPDFSTNFAKLVEKSGIPKGVVNIITGLGEPCGKALTTHDLVERIAFTGGPETAKHIVKNSAENLSQVSLELGGKSPVVVFNDAEQENALNGITAGIFGASGQSCIAGSRP